MNNKAKKILFLSWGSLFLAILLIFYLPKCRVTNSEDDISRLDVWTQKLESGQEKEILLPCDLYEEKDESIEIYTYLPEEFESAQNLCFWTFFQDVKVYLDGEVIYATEENRFGKAAVSQWNYVEVPAESVGQSLTICMSTPYDSYEFSLTEVVFGSMKGIEDWIFSSYGFNRLLDFSLMIVGVVVILCAAILGVGYKYKLYHLCFGTTSLLLGSWLYCGSKGNSFFIIDSYAAAFLANLAFFLIPIPLMLYTRVRVAKDNILEKISEAIVFLECLSVLAVFVMQALNVRDIRENIVVGQINLFTSIIWSVFIAIFYFIKLKKDISGIVVVNSCLLAMAVMLGYISENVENSPVRLDAIMRGCLIIIVLTEICISFLHFKRNEKVQKDMHEKNRSLQLQVLTGQIRPHFILNTLGAIRSLISTDPHRASDLLYDFSKYIRKNMEQKDYSKPIPFLEELDYIDTYLNLEKLRFNEKLQVEYDIQEDGFWILPLTVQPFVENAVKHGLLEKKQGGTVWILTYRKGKNIVVEIRDNGVGFDTDNFWLELEERKSVGMKSAIFRLQDGMHAKCEVESSMVLGKSGTRIKIIIPEKEAKRNENNNRR